MTKKTVLITGCSSGFGKLAAETFHDWGLTEALALESRWNILFKGSRDARQSNNTKVSKWSGREDSNKGVEQ